MKIGWIGTGIMGNAMCGHLIKAGNETYVYNRTASKTENLVAAGAKACSSVAEIAKNSDLVFSIVGMPNDVKETYLGENGLVVNSRPGQIFVDMTTSSPSLAVEIAVAASEKNVSVLDAPVSGGDLGAREATLAIMIGGEESIYQKMLPYFQAMGKNIKLMGKTGAGQHTKMSNQILIASTMMGTVESLLYAQNADLDLSDVISVIGSGAASSWSINNLGTRIAKDDFEPGFMIKHFLKDLNIALEEAAQMNIQLPGLELAKKFYELANDNGLGDKGTQALFQTIQGLS